MTDHRSSPKPPSPLEQLANVCDAICADELFDKQQGEIWREASQQTELVVPQQTALMVRAQQAELVVQAALNEAAIARIPPTQLQVQVRNNSGCLFLLLQLGLVLIVVGALVSILFAL
jgi:hypothetical protein